MSMGLQRLGKYELRERLGRGNVGEVWRAFDFQLKREIVLKVVHPDFQSDPHFFTRFTQQGSTLTALQQANIVQLHEVALSRPTSSAGHTTAYIAMEYVQGQTLADYLNATSRKGIFPSPNELVYLFTSLGIAIDYAHQQGIIHGDLKPENVLLDQRNPGKFPGGEPMLTDFALASMVGDDAPITSPFYMSPEQARSNPADTRSDIYALGIMLYELCTGVLPFRGESPVAIMMQQIQGLPVPPALVNASIPPALSEVILRAIAKNEALRFPMASLLAIAVADAFAMPSTIVLSSKLLEALNAEEEYRVASQPRLPILGIASLPQKQPSRPIHATPRPMITPAAYQTTPTTGPMSPITHGLPPFSPEPKRAAITRKIPVTPDVSQQPTLAAPLQNLLAPPPLPSIPPTPSVTAHTTRPFAALPTQPVAPPMPEQPIQLTYQPSSPVPPTYQPSSPLTMRHRLHTRITSLPLLVAIGILLLLLLIIGGTIGNNLFAAKGPSNGSTGVGSVFFQDDPLGHDDVLRVEISSIAAPPTGKSDMVWLQTNTHNTLLLGTLVIQNGTGSLLYTSNTQHTNLLSLMQQIVITQEDASNSGTAPTGGTLYTATPDALTFSYIKNILYATPNLPANSSVVAALEDSVKSMNDKAGSIVDSLRGTHDYGLAQRQATRIIELLDGTKYAQMSGDLPAKDAPQLFTKIGLLSSPNTKGYLDILDQQLTLLQQHSGNDAMLLQHIQHIQNAILDLKSWLQKIHDYDVQLLKAANLSDPTIVSTALQLRQLAADSYTGRTIPPNEGPLPIAGSAGAYQAYVEAQYMATLTLMQV